MSRLIKSYAWRSSMSKEEEVQNFSFEEVFDEETNCKQENKVFCYFQGLLGADDQKVFEEHLKICHGCARRLMELQETAETIENVSLDEEKSRQIFDENRTKLRARLDLKYPNQVKQIGGFPKLVRFSLPPYASALTLLTVAILIY